jgi:hypothetical protein
MAELSGSEHVHPNPEQLRQAPAGLTYRATGCIPRNYYTGRNGMKVPSGVLDRSSVAWIPARRASRTDPAAVLSEQGRERGPLWQKGGPWHV